MSGFSSIAEALRKANVAPAVPVVPATPRQVAPPPIKITEAVEERPTREQPSLFDDDGRGLAAFIVPAIGFEDVKLAREFQGSLGGLGDIYAPFNIDGRRWYVPHTWTDSISDFLVPDHHTFARSNQPKWLSLWKRENKMPEGGYTVMVLGGGRRQFYRYVHQTTKHPKWWYRIASGSRDCFVVWRNDRGEEIVNGLHSKDRDRHLYIARSGRAVVYAKVRRFTNGGLPDGYDVFAAMIKVGILDRDATRDPTIKVEARNCRISIPASEEKEYEAPFSYDKEIDPVWHEMVAEAMEGFNRFCQTVPAEVEAWRTFFLDQRAKLEADRKNYTSTSWIIRKSSGIAESILICL